MTQEEEAGGAGGLSPALLAWCASELGAVPVEQLFAVSQMSNVTGLRLDNGLCVVIKSRPDESGRAEACVTVQLAGQITLPDYVEVTAQRVRARLGRVDLSCVIVHADWESQNLRWEAGEPFVVHDWDSLAWQPEAAIAGAGAGAFASWGQPTLAPVESSAAFLEVYQQTRGQAFTAEEVEVAWAASLWTALHNARAELVWGMEPVANRAVAAQAEERLARARA